MHKSSASAKCISEARGCSVSASQCFRAIFTLMRSCTRKGSCYVSSLHCLPCCQVWAVKSYTKSVPLYIQVLQRNSLQLIAPFLDPEHDVIVSMEQTRHRLLALSCLCPGASTLIGDYKFQNTFLSVCFALHLLYITLCLMFKMPCQVQHLSPLVSWHSSLAVPTCNPLAKATPPFPCIAATPDTSLGWLLQRMLL